MGKRGTPRASCDPCRRKKVKCDKDQRNADGLSLCTFCCARGFECIITDEAAAARASKLLEREEEDSSFKEVKRRKIQPQTEQVVSVSATIADQVPSSHTFAPLSSMPSIGTSGLAALLCFPDLVPESSLLGVQGLTRTILEELVMLHFQKSYFCNPSIMPRHFFPRYRTFQRKLDGEAGPSKDPFPAPDILILAVACVGAGQARFLPGRFELQDRIFYRLAHLVRQADTNDPSIALDVAEAIILVCEIATRQKYTASFDPCDISHLQDPLRATSSTDKKGRPMDVNPFSMEMACRLVLHHGFNRSEQDRIVKAQRARFRTADNKQVWDANDIRIPLVTLVAAAHDSFRAFAMFERHCLLEEDLDPDDVCCDLGGPVSNTWAHQSYKLAAIFRSFNLKVCSAKSRRLGIPPAVIIDLLDTLKAFDQQLPEILRWRWIDASDEARAQNQLIEYDGAAEDPTAIIVKKAFLHLLYLGHIMCLHTLTMAHGIEKPKNGQGDWNTYFQARRRIDAALLEVMDQAVEIISQLASADLISYSAIALRGVPKHLAQCSLEIAKMTFKAGLHELTADLLSKAARAIYAFSTDQAHPETPKETADLRKELSKLYTEFEMIPGLGPMDDSKLADERSRFSNVFEPDLSTQAFFTGSVSAEVEEFLSGSSAALSTATSWSTPSTINNDFNSLSGSVAELMAGFPFIDPGTAATSPANQIPSQKTPLTQASPFDLNAFLESHMTPGSAV